MSQNIRRASRRGGDVAFDAANITLLLLFVLLCVYPFYYVFISSISDPSLAQYGVTFYPRGLTLSNYAHVFQLEGIYRSTYISTARTLVGTALTLVCCSFFGYLVSKQNMCCRKFVYRFVIITMYFNSGLVPWYLTLKSYRLNNTFWLYVIPSAMSAYYIVLLKTFIEQLPASLEESARLDGAGYLKCFFYIVVPLSKPILATIAVFAAVSQWNSWFDNYVLVTKDSLKTLQLVLYEALNEATSLASSMRNNASARGVEEIALTPQAVRMTITMVVTVPILLVYPFMQKYFVKGIMMGAIKG